MSLDRRTASRVAPALCGVLLACLSLSCSAPDGLLLNIHTPAQTPIKSYVIRVQDRSTRKVVFLSGLQKLTSGRDLSVEPLRVAMPFTQHGQILLQVLAANVDNVDALPQPGVNEPQLFFARILEIGALQELDVGLLPVAPAYDADGDHFPSATTWLAALPEAAAQYKDTPEVLDCADSDPPAGDILPVRTRAFDIHPLAQPQCNVMLRPAHAPTANPLPDFAPFDLSCAGQPRACADRDGDGDPEGSDCDDNDPNRFHGNPRPRNCCQCSDPKSCALNPKKLDNMKLCEPKRCDTAYDYDCTGLGVTCFTDNDCDGYSPTNADPTLRDCDDNDARVHPGAAKICDPPDGVLKDWACDGRPQATCVPCDLDGDGYQRQDPGPNPVCPLTNYRASGRPIDCDDNDRGVFPGAATYQGTANTAKFGPLDAASRGNNRLAAMRGLCRNTSAVGQAENTSCDGNIRQGCPSALCDKDQDGFVNSTPGCMVIGQPVDCNDNDFTIFPGAPLHCDGKDHDCDGTPDVCTTDRDKDGYDISGDCADNNSDVHPFNSEQCNGIDDDCDGLIDEQNPDAAGNPMVQLGSDGITKGITSCADSTVGLCGQKSNGFYTGHCVCSTVIPTSVKDKSPANVVLCPGQNDSVVNTARCFFANQPQKQTCDALNPVDDDCNGDLSDVSGQNLAEKDNSCGIDVTGSLCIPNSSCCKAGKVVGCDRSRVNPFFALQVPGFAAKDQYLVCANQIDPKPETCNGYDDDCNGQLGAQLGETDQDGDTYLACSGCTGLNTADPLYFNQAYLYCRDCADKNRNVYPPIPNSKYAGAPELCDGLDNKCAGGGYADGGEQCGSGTDAGRGTCCSDLMLCIDPQTDKNHCGGCHITCNDSTIEDSCRGGLCACGSDPACDPSNPAKAVCRAGKSCVQCVASADCPRVLGAGTATRACNTNSNLCVECTDNTFCTSAASPVCDVATNRCVRCLNNAQCTALGMMACRKDPGGDSTLNTCVTCVDNTTCAAPTAACNSTTNTCVQCVNNTTCAAPTAACNSTTNTCVQCVNNMTCAAPTPACNVASNTCVQCVNNTTCAAPTPACNTTTNLCVQCVNNTTCAAPTPACNVANNTCVQCVNNTTCAAPKPACNTTTNLCVQCLDNTTCAAPTPVCNTAANLCVQCLDNTTCAAPTPVCDPMNYTCVECLDDADCPVATPKCMKNMNKCM